MQLVAKLVEILAVQSGTSKSGNTWQKQNIILETDGMYPKKVCIALWGDKVNDALLQPGAMLDISFDIESREYNGNWYTDVRAWKIEAAGAAQPAVAGAAPQAGAPAPNVDFGASSGDDLPF